MPQTETNLPSKGAEEADSAAAIRAADRLWAAALLRRFQRYPVASAVAIAVVDVACITVVTLAVMALAPSVQPEFIALLVVTLLTAGFVTLLGWWRVTGFNPPGAWRALSLLLLPAGVIIVPPLIGGLAPVEGFSLPYLLLAYILVGLHEETLYRGVILRVLRPTGVRRAAVISAVLFGAAHLANVLVRSNPYVVVAQAVGAFCFGVGFSALRLRTNTIWFLIGLHAVHDLLLRYTQWPVIPLDVVQVTILLVYGLYLLRNWEGIQEEPNVGHTTASVH
ncbi:MAG: CPBP family intramembrane metalloprotease [Caldilineaceae bacterium]|nr:CPBP family intramembrane metalloprotease [Caldilineaceae bacterium]